MIKNPILPGCYPDPSIVRVDDTFYLITSSFCYFPGIPIFKSKNLAQWEQIGHVLDRTSQLHTTHEWMSAGIFAPTIRYNNGTFYMIVTNISMNAQNMIATAKDPAGEWSEIRIIEGADGIDPSLFFDDDGRAYYTGSSQYVDENGNDRRGIWASEIDIEKMALKGERRVLWHGALEGAAWPEAPHIYKKDGWYYLMIAEGGTGRHHAVTISRSKSPMGTYIGNKANPILTHRHLGKDYPICNVGHADLVETEGGEWYMVCLATRPTKEGHHELMGRETFIAPVIWEDGWPVAAPMVGRLQDEYPLPKGCAMDSKFQRAGGKCDFDSPELSMEWNFLGTPFNKFWKIEDSMLKIKYLSTPFVPERYSMDTEETFNSHNAHRENHIPGFIGRRQQHHEFSAQAKMSADIRMGETAGLAAVQSDANIIKLECRRLDDGHIRAACIKGSTIQENDQFSYETKEESFIIIEAAAHEDIYLEIKGSGAKFSLYAGNKPSGEAVALDTFAGHLGSETAGGFIGTYIGMYAHAREEDDDRYAGFDWFKYEGNEKK
ncbi:MAG: glycoside hydrolase family 43 protein [Clostridia bacterium]|nr:glycoside hydrolase family 43 protein [Clostridia bacterium]